MRGQKDEQHTKQSTRNPASSHQSADGLVPLFEQPIGLDWSFDCDFGDFTIGVGLGGDYADFLDSV